MPCETWHTPGGWSISANHLPFLALDHAGCAAGYPAVNNGRVGLGIELVNKSRIEPESIAQELTLLSLKTPRHVDLVDKLQCGASSIPISR